MFDQLRSLAIFSKVAEVGSFSGAAKMLNLTAPVVSQHVSQLEKELQLPLVYRSTRSLRLTDAGEKLAVSARQMLDIAEAGLDEIIGEDLPPHGKLSVAAPGIADYEPFLDGLTKYRKLFPDIELTISFDDKIRDLIREGFDLGIRSAQTLTDSSSISRKLIDSPMKLVCTAEYIKEHGQVSKPADLQSQGYQWIGMPVVSKTVILQRKDNPEIKIEVARSISLTVDSYRASYNLAQRGNGLVSLSTIDSRVTNEPQNFVEPLPQWELEPTAFYAVWPANAGARSLTRHFLQFLLTEIAKNKSNEIQKG